MLAVIRYLLGETEHFRLISPAALIQFFLESLKKTLKIVSAPGAAAMVAASNPASRSS